MKFFLSGLWSKACSKTSISELSRVTSPQQKCICEFGHNPKLLQESSVSLLPNDGWMGSAAHYRKKQGPLKEEF